MKAEVERLVGALIEFLRGVHEYTDDDIARFRPDGMHERVFKLAVHRAKDALLDNGIGFSVLNGVHRKIQTAKQARGKASRRATAAINALERSVKIVRLGAAKAHDPEEKRRMERLEVKRANAVVAARAAVRGAGIPRPPGI